MTDRANPTPTTQARPTPDRPTTATGEPVGLIETMRAERGRIAWLDLHLARLAESARAFGYPLDLAETRRLIREALAVPSEPQPTASSPARSFLPPGEGQGEGHSAAGQKAAGERRPPDLTQAESAGRRSPRPHRVDSRQHGNDRGEGRGSFDGDARVRLVLWPDGRLELTTGPLPRDGFRSAAVYPEPIPESGTWRCTHKTTDREHYARALDWAERVGVEEPILTNARGEVTEGARTNVFIRRGGALLTPPLSAGGLGGVLRRSLVDAGDAQEATLTPGDLARADAVLLSNAVRGLVPVNFLARTA